MDIETVHFEDKDLTTHLLQDKDGSFWVCITTNESSDAVYESRGWETVDSALLLFRMDNQMLCRDCNVEMVEGTAIVPLWGTLDGRPIQNGTTLNMVDGCQQQVMKCPNCGHSVYFGKMLIDDKK